jgi:hypothetical protein
MTATRLLLVCMVGGLALTLSACDPSGGAPTPTVTAADPTPVDSPTPVPEPTKPALSELVITPEGLGNVGIGVEIAAVAPEFDAAVFVADYCAAYDGVDPGKWVANYEPALSRESADPFNFYVDEHNVPLVLSVGTSEIPTDHGVRVGDTEDALVAAYPEGFDERIVRFDGATTLHVVHGTHGQLIYEVFNDDILEDGSFQHQVWNIHVLTIDEEPYGFANTDAGWGTCVTA